METLYYRSGKGKTVPVQWRKTPDSDPVKVITQAPRMYSPFAVNEYTPDDGGAPKLSVQLAFKGAGVNVNEQATDEGVYEFISAIDMANVEHAVLKQESWWGPGRSRRRSFRIDTIHLKLDKNGKYEPTMRCKLNFREGSPTFKIFDNSQPPVERDMSYIEPGCSIVCLVELGPLCVADKKTWSEHPCRSDEGVQERVYRVTIRNHRVQGGRHGCR